MSDRNTTQEAAIFSLWLKWLIAEGALFIPNVLSVYLPAVYIPIVCIVLAIALLMFERSSFRSFSVACPLILSISIRGLLVSAFIMGIVSMFHRHGWSNYFIDLTTINPAIPYVTALIISPVVLVLTIWALIRGPKYGVCRRCIVEYGPMSERGPLGEMVTREGRYQLTFLMSISLVLTLFTWIYYLVWYVNININIPDRFVFGWVPVVLYVVSIFYMGARCFTLWSEHFEDRDEAGEDTHPSSISLRILIIHGNSIFLSRTDDLDDLPAKTAEGEIPHVEFDTPAAFGLPYEKNLPLGRASEIFAKLSDLRPSDFTMRFLYSSREILSGRTTYHYVCTPSDPALIASTALSGRWFNLPQFTSLYQNRELTPMLAAEIYRIYTVAMAWKTYDREGRRLYKIKNYRPLFRLEGICDWDVDFNSPHWLTVSRFNEDRPFWRLRRMFNRLALASR
ncbi:MAG: hypothetical protein HDS40_03985 [Bacteroides sp.]|nr:hypothetical protein [Bacteroides sp.]MBD5271400.1 hypothetical protein [Bacteroides sp.]